LRLNVWLTAAIPESGPPMGPLAFALYTLIVFSALQSIAYYAIGLDTLFFPNDPIYRSRMTFLTEFARRLSSHSWGLSFSTILDSLSFVWALGFGLILVRVILRSHQSWRSLAALVGYLMPLGLFGGLVANYRARNLFREAKTLAQLDRDSRSFSVDGDALISGNREILDNKLKFPTVLSLDDGELRSRPNRQIGFLFRRVYLGYLQAQADLLSRSLVTSTSDAVARELQQIQKQLSWLNNDLMYVDIPSNPDEFGERLIQRWFPEFRF